jgi:threonine dehydratase
MTVESPTIRDIRAAQRRIAGASVRTPLVPLNLDVPESDIYLKLENLQPIGSFKIRGACNAMRQIGSEALRSGVYTASAGNMAQGVAWNAREMGVPCRVVVPEQAPDTKVAAIERLGGSVVRRPFDDWWQVIVDHGSPEMTGTFIHPVCHPAVIAGNGTIGLEILQDLPDVDAVVIPFGGGGLSCGIAAALREQRPQARVYASEVATAAPLQASLAAGEPTTVDYEPSFVDGIGSRRVLSEMWPLIAELIPASLVVTVAEAARSVRLLLERNRIVAEGAAATAVAAAISGAAGKGRIVCVISGGNIDLARLRDIMTNTQHNT